MLVDFKETKLNKQLDDLLVGVFENDSESRRETKFGYKFYKSLYLPVSLSLPFIDKNHTIG